MLEETTGDFFSFMDWMIRRELVDGFWDNIGKEDSFIPHIMEFLTTADLGKVFTESQVYQRWLGIKAEMEANAPEGGAEGGGPGGPEGPGGGPGGPGKGPRGPPGPPPPTFGEILEEAKTLSEALQAVLDKIPATGRRKRQAGVNKDLCGVFAEVTRGIFVLYELKDGAAYSPAKMNGNMEMKKTLRDLEGATTADVESCLISNEDLLDYIPTIQAFTTELSDWVKLKEFKDGFDVTDSDECDEPTDITECGCECGKLNKVGTQFNNHVDKG